MAISLKRKKRAQSATEMMTLLIFVLGALLVFQKYIVRGFSGKWKSGADAFGYGKQYDPRKTVECGRIPQVFNGWFNSVCLEEQCGDICYSFNRTPLECKACIIPTCLSPLCRECSGPGAGSADCLLGRERCNADYVCECAGDCDNDGKVTQQDIIDITGASPAIFAGCEEVDINNNGTLDPSELSAAQDNFNQGCPRR